MKPYLQRIKKKSKQEWNHVEKFKLESLVKLIKSKDKDERKPLTAFSSSIMLNKDPEREIKLLPDEKNNSLHNLSGSKPTD